MDHKSNNIALDLVLTAYANKYGDTALLQQFEAWSQKHMGINLRHWYELSGEDQHD
jgi:hypothetical protein